MCVCVCVCVYVCVCVCVCVRVCVCCVHVCVCVGVGYNVRERDVIETDIRQIDTHINRNDTDRHIGRQAHWQLVRQAHSRECAHTRILVHIDFYI